MLESTRKLQRELNSGVTALLTLGLVRQAGRPVYGYELAMQLAGLADDELPMNQGALYPVLRSLERIGLLSSEIEPSAAGPPRRYYAITEEGRKAYIEWKQAWGTTSTLVKRVLENRHAKRKRNAARRASIS